MRSLAGSYAAIAAAGGAANGVVNTRRRLDYAAFVVVLYAAFERFVEDLVWARAEIDAKRRKYTELSDDLKRKHLRSSADLLLRRHLGTGRYETLTVEEVVANLHLCLSESDPYRLTRAAVVRHEQNLRAEVVAGLFSTVGIDSINASACRADVMLQWFMRVDGRQGVSAVPTATVELRVKDLIDRRNQIAHSGGAIGELLAPEEMEAHLEFFEVYATALFHVVGASYIGAYYIGSDAISLGGLVEGPFQKGFVVVVEKPKARLFKGQQVFSVVGGRVARWGEVLEIRIEDVTVEEVAIESESPLVGLRLSFPSTKSVELFAMSSNDDLVWP